MAEIPDVARASEKTPPPESGPARESERRHSLCWLDCGGNLKSRGVRRRGSGRAGRQYGQPAPPAVGMGIGHGLPGSMVPGFFPLLFAPHSFRTLHRFQDRISRRLRFGCGHKVAAEISHLGRSPARSPLRHLRTLHAPGVHARLEAERG